MLIFNLFSVFIACHGLDYLTSAPFEMMFPFIESQYTINEVTFAVNNAQGIKQAIGTLNKWIDENWNTPPSSTIPPIKNNTTTPYDPYNFGRLADKEYARHLAVTYLEHRQAVKHYQRILTKSTLFLEYFTATEVEQVGDLFWKTDIDCYNYFDCTESQFFDRMRAMFFDTHKNLLSDLKLLTDPLHKFPVIGERMGWKYER